MRVLVTGANQGFGLALCRELLARGHRVFAGVHRGLEHREIAGLEQGDEKLTLLDLDVTDEVQMVAAATAIGDRGLDAVVSNAGVLCDSDRTLPITQVNQADLELALRVNVVGAALVIKHFHGLVRDGGWFLTITSEGGSMTNVGTTYPAYSITKSAENKLVAVFAKTVDRYRILAVHPGRMNTVMGRTYAQIEPEESAGSIADILEGARPVPEENGWFVNYRGESMEI